MMKDTVCHPLNYEKHFLPDMKSCSNASANTVAHKICLPLNHEIHFLPSFNPWKTLSATHKFMKDTFCLPLNHEMHFLPPIKSWNLPPIKRYKKFLPPINHEKHFLPHMNSCWESANTVFVDLNCLSLKYCFPSRTTIVLYNILFKIPYTQWIYLFN